MQHLFSPAGQAALAAIVRRRPLLAFDFDGTLAPIVDRPEDARLAPEVAQRLAALAQRLPVAIVTGRQVDDVRPRLGFEPGFIVGSHGAEDEGGAAPAPAMTAALDRVRTRIGAYRGALRDAGVTIEDKGASLALHYRLSRTRERALELIHRLLEPRDGELRVFGGKLVVNVVARRAPDKAAALRSILERSGASCALFAGDDVNDEPVFASAPADWLTIHVGDAKARSLARWFVESPTEMAALLARIEALLAAG